MDVSYDYEFAEEETETESEDESCQEDELICKPVIPSLHEDKVFIGPVSEEELRLNKRIGGRATVAYRFSSTGSLSNVEDSFAFESDSMYEEPSEAILSPIMSIADQSMELESLVNKEEETVIAEDENLHEKIILIQSFIRCCNAKRTKQYLLEEQIKQQKKQQLYSAMKDMIVNEIMPNICDDAFTITRKNAKEKSTQCFQKSIVVWKKRADDDLKQHLFELQQQKAKEMEKVPEYVNTAFKELPPAQTVNCSIDVAARLQKIREMKLGPQSMTGECKLQNITDRTNTLTENALSPHDAQQEDMKQKFYALVQKRREKIKLKMLPKAINNENSNAALNVQ